MSTAKHTPGPWHLCQHLKSMECDKACSCGYRGAIYGPEHNVAMAICQPGHEPAPAGEEGTEPQRYPREVEIANAHLIAAAPDLLESLIKLLAFVESLNVSGDCGRMLEDWADLSGAAAAIAKATGESQ